MSNLKTRHLKKINNTVWCGIAGARITYFFVPISVAFVSPKATGNPPFINVFFF